MKVKRVALVVWAAGFALVLYAGLAALAFLCQRTLMYPAPSNPVEPRAEGATLERIEGPGGTTVYALYAPAARGAPTIVHFHGNGEDLAAQGWFVDAMRAAGLGAFPVEYPGYGWAQGAPLGEDAIYASAEAALVYLETKLGVCRDAIVLQGQSLGTGVAAEMARRGHGAKLVLVSPYTSMVDMAALVTPFLPVRWLVRDRYDTLRKAPALDLPTLVIHGTSDEVIPFEMGRLVAARLPKAEFVSIPDGHHADLFFRSGREALLARIVAFARGEIKSLAY
jgi:pimeloyl-ACP methyl ester carboxylesterase